ncbi:hypothetical protein HFD88_008993 [Aspergillus terreus]|nr:hypothetical protein HFD88_008993 [Aspergillus terreus]
MDPISVGGLVLGAASLAVQVFNGVKKGLSTAPRRPSFPAHEITSGYEYFESALDMPEECESLRLRLRIEYTRLLDWGDLAGLSEERDNHTFDRKLLSNRAMTITILSEMRSLLKQLGNMSLVHQNQRGGREGEDTECKGGKEQEDSLCMGKSSHDLPMLYRKVVADTAIDLEDYHGIFQSRKLPLRTRRHMTGLNHIIKLSQGLKDVVKNPQRIVWALKDKEQFQGQLRRLKELTDFLHESMGDSHMQTLMETNKETCMAMLQLTKSVQEMKELLNALHLVPGSGNERNVDVKDVRPQLSRAATLVEPCMQDGEDGAFEQRESPDHLQMTFERLTSFGVVSLEIRSDRNVELKQRKLDAEQLPNLLLEDDDQVDDCSRTLGTYYEKRVWIEWKAYQGNPSSAPSGDTVWDADPQTVENLERLVALLCEETKPAEFRIPPCLGYFQDEEMERFGIIFPLPPGKRGDPRSLLQRLGEEPATIRSRVNIAREISTSLLYLHAVNWLHKGLRSANILFFSDDEPYLSGFEYSRPDEGNLTTAAGPDEWEWAIYSHPDYVGPDRKTYRRTYDIYSLGIILLEIGYWKKAEEFLIPAREKSTDKPRRKSLSQMRKTRERLLWENPELLDHVRMTMGDLYYHAVRACIEGLPSFRLPKHADETDPVVGALLQQAYVRLVVGVLQSITV